MEYVPGESLDRHSPPGRLPVSQMIDIARALAEALVAAHEKGVIQPTHVYAGL